jgi:methyl-accepting chemotaxis protein
MIQERKQEMAQEMQGMADKVKEKVYQNQNRVREAVHSLLAMEDLVGGIGPQVREIARNFNNSVQATIRAEERAQRRNALQRFFAGGDNEAAEEIEEKVNQNKERIQQLKQLREECACGSEVKEIMREQIQNMEQEQTRLQELAQREKGKGLFGWLWK